MKYLKIIIIVLIVISISLLVAILFIKQKNDTETEKNIINSNQENVVNNITESNIIENQTNQNITANENIDLLEQQEEKEYYTENPGMIIDGIIPQKTTSQYVLLTLQNCVRQYINYILSADNIAIYNILDNEYVTNNNINQNNVLDYVYTYTYGNVDGFIEIYEVVGDTYGTYYIKYQLGENIIFLTVNIDILTDSFSVVPLNEEQYNTKTTEPAVGTKDVKTILRNRYNNINYVTM